MNVFEAVKQSVTTRQAAEHYGIRVGRNGMACCPFHNDKTPSMRVDERYYCFGCGVTGDVIDFVASLCSLGKKDAAIQLAEDFGIAYESNHRKRVSYPAQKTKPKITFEERFEQTQVRCVRVLLDYLHLLGKWKAVYAPKSSDEEWHPRFCKAVQEISYIEYLLDILLFGETEEQAALIVEQGKKVIEFEQRIKEYDNDGTAEAIGGAGCVGTGTDGNGNTGDAGIYTERSGEKQSA